MTESQLYERIGRMQVTTEAQDAAYTAALQLLAGVVGGKIEPSRVLVNLTDRTWTLAPEGFRPEVPATINGLPQCVTAPAEGRLDLAHAAIAALEADNARLMGLVGEQPPS